MGIDPSPNPDVKKQIQEGAAELEGPFESNARYLIRGRFSGLFAAGVQARPFRAGNNHAWQSLMPIHGHSRCDYT